MFYVAVSLFFLCVFSICIGGIWNCTEHDCPGNYILMIPITSIWNELEKYEFVKR